MCISLYFLTVSFKGLLLLLLFFRKGKSESNNPFHHWKTNGSLTFQVEIFSGLLYSSVCLVLYVFSLRNRTSWSHFLSVIFFSLNWVSYSLKHVISTNFILFIYSIRQPGSIYSTPSLSDIVYMLGIHG